MVPARNATNRAFPEPRTVDLHSSLPLRGSESLAHSTVGMIKTSGKEVSRCPPGNYNRSTPNSQMGPPRTEAGGSPGAPTAVHENQKTEVCVPPCQGLRTRTLEESRSSLLS